MSAETTLFPDDLVVKRNQRIVHCSRFNHWCLIVCFFWLAFSCCYTLNLSKSVPSYLQCLSAVELNPDSNHLRTNTLSWLGSGSWYLRKGGTNLVHPNDMHSGRRAQLVVYRQGKIIHKLLTDDTDVGRGRGYLGKAPTFVKNHNFKYILC